MVGEWQVGMPNVIAEDRPFKPGTRRRRSRDRCRLPRALEQGSVGAYAGALEHLIQARRFSFDFCRKHPGCAGDDFRACAEKSLPGLRRGEHLGDFLMQALQDGGRRLGRRARASPLL